MVTLLYFAWVHERIGRGEEQIDLPAGVVTVADVIEMLAARGEGYRAAFAERAKIRVAVDLAMATPATTVGDAREIAFFPPVTGG